MTPIFATRLQQHHDVPMTPRDAERYLAFLREYGPTIGNCFNFGGNARADAPVENVPRPARGKNSARTDTGPEIRQPGISAGPSTLYARPSSLHNRPATPPDAGAGSTYTNVPGVAGGDPFAQYDNTPVALYRDGQEYERDAMRDGAFND